MQCINNYGSPAILGTLLQKEQNLCCNGYLNRRPSPTVISATDRVRMVDWMYSVIDQLEYDRETVAIATQMMDRFLSKPSNQTSLQSYHSFQLLSVTAMYIAIKSNEPSGISTAQVVQIINHEYSANDIEDMETVIMQDLHTEMGVLTSLTFAKHILALICPHVDVDESSWKVIIDEVCFQTECSVRDYHLSTQTKPSNVALAAILNAVDVLGYQFLEMFHDVLQLVMDEALPSPHELAEARNSLSLLVEAAGARPIEQEPSGNTRSIPRTVSFEQLDG